MIDTNGIGLGSAQPQGNGAVIDDTKTFRYLLWRTWDVNRPRLLWVMLNPSTADEQQSDRTLGRCISFSKKWDYGSLEIVNLFAFRTSDPKDLDAVSDPIGSENDRRIAEAATRAEKIVVAWGERGIYKQRDSAVLELLAQQTSLPLYCLGKTKNGSPRHPLYIAGTTVLTPYSYQH